MVIWFDRVVEEKTAKGENDEFWVSRGLQNGTRSAGFRKIIFNKQKFAWNHHSICLISPQNYFALDKHENEALSKIKLIEISDVNISKLTILKNSPGSRFIWERQNDIFSQAKRAKIFLYLGSARSVKIIEPWEIWECSGGGVIFKFSPKQRFKISDYFRGHNSVISQQLYSTTSNVITELVWRSVYCGIK